MQTTTTRAPQLRLVTAEQTPTEQWIRAIRRESPFGLVRVAPDGPSTPLRQSAHRKPAAA